MTKEQKRVIMYIMKKGGVGVRYTERVAKIIDRLEERGYEAYIVGGSVRDMLLGKEPNDYDVTTSALPEETLEVFSDMRTIPTGLKHGTVTVLSSGEPIEITTFRVDGEYLDSRRPESVSFTKNVVADLSRRDFTVNAMAYNEKRGLIDEFGGREDLKNKIIRAVGKPEQRFFEDALRIMRAFRFSAQLDFYIDPETLRGIRETKEGLGKIAAERIAAEFVRTICTNTPNTTLRLMREYGIFEYITEGYCPSDKTLFAMELSPRVPQIRLGIFFSEIGADRAGEIMRALKLSNKLIADTKRIVTEATVSLRGSGADARRLIGRCGEHTLDVLLAAKSMGNLEDEFEKTVIEEVEKKSCASADSLAVNGGDLVKLGARGREVGELLSMLLERVIEEPALNEKNTLLDIARERLLKG